MSDPTGTDRPLWRDYSRYQVMVNFDVAKANGVLGMAARAGISWGYVDPFFATNYKGAGQVGLYRTSYHVLYPDQPVIKQADNWYAVHPEINIIPRVIDLELDRGQSWSKIAAQTWAMSELVKSRDGMRPIIYSRYRIVDQWLQSWTDQMHNDHFWWLAQYSWYGYREHAGPPTLPKRVRRGRVILHQTSDHKLAPPGEVQSKAVDWDRWEIGNEQEMHDWIATAWGSMPPPPPPPPSPYIERVKVTASALNVREKAEATSADLGELLRSSVVPVSEVSGVWKKITGWIHGDYTEPV